MPSNSESLDAVLIVEDEPLVRMEGAYSLKDAGFEVHQAANADEAIAVLEAHKEIRLVFTDVQMPGSMDGLKLAHYVRTRWPPIHLIVTSGQVNLAEDALPAGAVFMSKPYDHQALASKVRAMIAA